MAIDYTGISSLNKNAPEIKYTGGEGPRSPEENRQIALSILGEENGNIASELWNGMSPPEKNEWGSIEGFIQSEDFKIILMQTKQEEGGIRTASAADDMLQDEYDKYVFEMQEQGLEPMSLEQFRQEAVAGMANGGIADVGFSRVQPSIDGSRPGYAFANVKQDLDRQKDENRGPQNIDRQVYSAIQTQKPPAPLRGEGPDQLPPQLGGPSSRQQAAAILAQQPSRRGGSPNVLNPPTPPESLTTGGGGIPQGITNIDRVKRMLSRGRDIPWSKYLSYLDPFTSAEAEEFDAEAVIKAHNEEVLGKGDTTGTTTVGGQVPADLANPDVLMDIARVGGLTDIEKGSKFNPFSKDKEVLQPGAKRVIEDIQGFKYDNKISPKNIIEYFGDEEKYRGMDLETLKKVYNMAQVTGQSPVMAAEGGIARLGYANGQLVQPGPGRPGYQGDRPPSVRAREHEEKQKDENRGKAMVATPTESYSKKTKELLKKQREGAQQTIKQQQKEYERGPDSSPYARAEAKAKAKAKAEEVSFKEKFKQKSSDFRKRELRNLFDYIYGGRKRQLPGWSTLTRKPQYGEDWYTDPDLFDEFSAESLGLSATDLQKLQDIQKALGQEYVGQTKKFADDDQLAFQDFYPNMNKIQPGDAGYVESSRGPDPLWQRQGHPSEAAYLAAQGTGTTAAPLTQQAAAAGTSPFPTGPIDASGITSTYNLTGAENMLNYLPTQLASGVTRGTTFDPITGELKFIGADGGRAGYANGGITDLRQGYFLGKLVKSLTKPFKGATRSIKKFAKTPAGKLAIMAALGYGTGMFGKSGTGMFSGLKTNLFGTAAKGGGALPWKMTPGKMWTPGTEGWLGKLGLTKGGGSMMPTALGGILGSSILGGLYTAATDDEEDEMYKKWLADKAAADEYWIPRFDESNFRRIASAQGGRIGYAGGKLSHKAAYLQSLYGNDEDEVQYAQEGGLMDLGGMEKDYRQEGGFVPIGGQERADDVPARLSKNEFVFTADAVRAAGGGDIDKGAEVMENVMENLEQGGQVSEESQGLEGARNMFATAQRLEGVL